MNEIDLDVETIKLKLFFSFIILRVFPSQKNISMSVFY
jgi:hypothetical protein